MYYYKAPLHAHMHVQEVPLQARPMGIYVVTPTERKRAGARLDSSILYHNTIITRLKKH